MITKDTKFKDLPDPIKARLLSLTRKKEVLSMPHSFMPDNMSSISMKISDLGLQGLKDMFDQSVVNCECFKENKEPKVEDMSRSVDKELERLGTCIEMFKESQQDGEFLSLMHEVICTLQKRVENIKIPRP